MLACTCHPSEHSTGWPGKKPDPISKITRAQKCRGVAQVIESLLSGFYQEVEPMPLKNEDLSSNHSTAKNK
jgi:hypothetical protein